MQVHLLSRPGIFMEFEYSSFLSWAGSMNLPLPIEGTSLTIPMLSRWVQPACFVRVDKKRLTLKAHCGILIVSRGEDLLPACKGSFLADRL